MDAIQHERLGNHIRVVSCQRQPGPQFHILGWRKRRVVASELRDHVTSKHHGWVANRTQPKEQGPHEASVVPQSSSQQALAAPTLVDATHEGSDNGLGWLLVMVCDLS